MNSSFLSQKETGTTNCSQMQHYFFFINNNQAFFLWHFCIKWKKTEAKIHLLFQSLGHIFFSQHCSVSPSSISACTPPHYFKRNQVLVLSGDGLSPQHSEQSLLLKKKVFRRHHCIAFFIYCHCFNLLWF